MPHVHCENAQIINGERFKREIRTYDAFMEQYGSGNIIVASRAQLSLALQRMDLLPGMQVPEAGTRGTNNPGITTSGAFAEVPEDDVPTTAKGTSKKPGAVDEGGAAFEDVLETETLQAKKKKKGVHRA